MSIPARSARPGTYFVTSRTSNSRRVLQLERNAELFLETLQHYEREGHYMLHAFVIMPDHIHLMLTPTGVTLERAMMLIKGGFSTAWPQSFLFGKRASLTIASATKMTWRSIATTSTKIQFEHTSAEGRKTIASLPLSRLRRVAHSRQFRRHEWKLITEQKQK